MWISTKERLPEDAEQIIVALEYKQPPLLTLCALYSNETFFNLETMDEMDNVAFWCELPIPPTK